MVRHHLIGVRAGVALSAAALLGIGPRAVRPAAAPHAPSGAAVLRSGDLAFRIGVGWRADAVRALSRTAYSHVGVVVVTPHGVDVVHAAPPEGAEPGVVVEETLTTFSSPVHATGVAFFRRGDVDAGVAGRAAVAARAFAVARVPFDDRFDLTDGRALYCTELVLRAYATAGAPLPVRPTSLGGALGGVYVLPRDLVASGRLRPLAIAGALEPQGAGWPDAEPPQVSPRNALSRSTGSVEAR